MSCKSVIAFTSILRTCVVPKLCFDVLCAISKATSFAKASYLLAAACSAGCCRPKAHTGWNITKASRSNIERHTDQKRPDKTKKLISLSMTGKNLGRKHSEAHKKAISAGSMSKFRPVDIYDFCTEKPLTKNVSLRLWCKLNGYSSGNLYLTLHADFSKPHHHLSNKYNYRLIYARWSEEA